MVYKLLRGENSDGSTKTVLVDKEELKSNRPEDYFLTSTKNIKVIGDVEVIPDNSKVELALDTVYESSL